MLRGVSIALAQRGWLTSVIAQVPRRIEELAEEAAAKAAATGGRINPLPVDYARDPDLAEALDHAIASFGPISLAVSWIHDNAPRALPIIARRLDGLKPTARLFQLLTTDAADPRLTRATLRIEQDFPGIEWRRILFGSTTRGGQSRWLGDEEISTGVLNAIDHDWVESVVGLVKPSSIRPR